mgnify:CR=1 FL=1|jgi:hypothetical protein
MSGLINSAGSKSGVIGTTELDYEEGSWTPILKAGGTTMSGSTGNASPMGRYIKQGRIIFVTMSIWSVPKGSASGTITIEGLPFSQTSTDSSNLCSAYFTGQQEYYPAAYNPQPIYRINPAASTIAVYDADSAGAWMDPYDASDVQYNYFYKGFATYFVD